MENKQLERISFKHLINEILKILNLKRGLLRTCLDLLLRPRKVAQTYLYTDRKLYTSPIQFSVIWVGFWTVLLNFVFKGMEGERPSAIEASFLKGASRENMNPEELKRLQELTAGLMDNYLTYQNLLNWALIPIAALITYFFYRKVKWYYAEHLVLNAYVTGIVSLVGILTLPIEFIAQGVGIQVGGFLALLYMAWSYMDVFQERSFKGFLKGLVAVVFYYILSFVAMSGVFALYGFIVMKGGG